MVQNNRRQNLTEDERNLIAQWLLQNCSNNKMRHGALAEAASKYGVHRNTINNIWKAAHHQLMLGVPVQIKSGKKGKKRVSKKSMDEGKIRSLSVLERSSYRLMAEKLGCSKTLVYQWVKNKQLRAHTNSIKPTLTEENKLKRLKWSLNQLVPQTVDGNGKLSFQKMDNVIHIDEKWFNLTKLKDRYYMLPGEEDPHRTCKSKRFIEKLTFLAAVSKPQYSQDGTCIFDGKIGIFPFTTLEPAARNSKNRPKGTLITKPVASVNHEVMKDVMINKLLPTIIQKWPDSASRHIIIQQDNAKPHIKQDDADFIKAASESGLHIQLVNQPANSPDCNVNDLGFFRAIQTLKDRKHAKGVDDLLKNVTEAFYEFETQKLTNVFLTLQGCCIEIMKQRGGNNYKVPHMYKDKHIREGTLPEFLQVDAQLVQDCLHDVNQAAIVDAMRGMHMDG